MVMFASSGLVSASRVLPAKAGAYVVAARVYQRDVGVTNDALIGPRVRLVSASEEYCSTVAGCRAFLRSSVHPYRCVSSLGSIEHRQHRRDAASYHGQPAYRASQEGNSAPHPIQAQGLAHGDETRREPPGNEHYQRENLRTAADE